MFCPNCGKMVPDGSKFCGSCGANLSDAFGAAPPAGGQPNYEAPPTPVYADHQAGMQQGAGAAAPTHGRRGRARAAGTQQGSGVVPPKSGRKNKAKVIGIAAAAVLVVAAVVIGAWQLTSRSGGSSGNAYVYLSDGDYELITNLSKGESVEIASSRSDYTYSSLLSFSPDGKYVYYYTRYDSSSGTGTLCRAEYGKLKANSSRNDNYIETIASNVSLGFQFQDDGTVLYENGDDALYYYDGSESTRLARSVNYFYTDGTGRVVYTTGTYSEGYALYGIDLADPANAVKLASNYSLIYSLTDLDTIYYGKEDDDGNTMLYVTGFDRDSEQLAKNVTVLSVSDGTIYFTTENGQTLTLYDYVDDAYASEDAGITEPDPDDYQIPAYDYVQLSSSDEAGDYDELYTSCSKTVYFFHTAMKNKTSSSYALAQAFVEKYMDTENEDGYFVVTSAIQAELQEMCDEYGQGYDNEWLEFCFSKEEDGTTLDEDAYYAALETYENAADRIIIREVLQDSENAYPLKTLYCCTDGVLTAVSENVLSTRSCSGAVLYNTADMVTDSVSLTSVSYTSDVTDLFALDYADENYLLCYDVTAAIQLSADAAADMDDVYYDSGYLYLYVTGSNVFMTDSDGNIYVAAIDGTVGEFTLVSDNAYVLMRDGSTLYYAYGSYSNNSAYYFDLYTYSDGESKLLARDILEGNINIYEDGVTLVYTDYQSSYGYELTMIDEKGELITIAEDVRFYLRSADGSILYISDGDLYCYDGDERTLVGRDADWCWAMNTMESKNVYSDYGSYDGDYYY